jgi:signal transduction histidine kinase
MTIQDPITEVIQTEPSVRRPRRWTHFARLASSLPRGGSLPQEVWQKRQRWILALLWAHVGIVLLFGLFRGYGLRHCLFEAAQVGAFAILASLKTQSRKFISTVSALGLLTASAVLVDLSGGTIEMHFHFFVIVGLLTLYEDWLPFLVAVGFVLIHHAVVGELFPNAVFDTAAARAKPLLWAGIHAFFVAAAGAVFIVAWRLNEDVRARLAESSRQLALSMAKLEAIDEDRRKLLDRTVTAAEEERIRVAAELHDGPVQHLTALDLRLEGLRHRLEGAGATTSASAGRIQEGLREEIQGLRRMMTELRPPALDERGLDPALRDYVGKVAAETGLECSVESHVVGRLPRTVDTILYRVAQEAVTNVVKHASARTLRLSLQGTNGVVELDIRDDGVGFAMDDAGRKAAAGHFGLIGMRERVAAAGGEFLVDSRPGKGTHVHVSLPRESVAR